MTETDKKTGGFRSASEFFVAVRKFCDGEHKDNRIDALYKATMAEGADSTGGVLVPTEWATQIYNAALENSIVRSRAQIVPMKTDSINIQTLVDSDRSSNLFGGVTLAWFEEEEDRFASTVKPVLGNLQLVAHEATMSCFISNRLEDDADRFAQFLTRTFGDALRFYEDNAFIWGTGSGQPHGIMYAPALLSPARTNGFAVADPTDIGTMASRLLPGSWKNAVWLINQKTFASWATVTTSGANTLGVIDLSTMTCLGRPIIVTEKCAAPGSLGDFILADFSQYVIGDRDMYISASRHATYSTNTYGFLQGQTCWKITLRVAGQPTLSAAITPLNGGDTLSPFVALTQAS